MKKISMLLVAILLAFTSFATACMNPGGPGAPLGEGGLSSQEVSNLYREMAVQMWEKIGATVTLPTQRSGNTNFSVVVPDKKTETTDEGAIKNIQMNAKDAGGIMYLMSLLYGHEDYVTVDGLAGFDATYTQLGNNITQTIYLNTSINQDIGKVNFEAMVLTPQYNTWGYTNAEFTFDFSSSRLIECRFMMGDETDCVDMMLTSDGRYMWYRTSEMDDFASALMSLKEEYVQRYSSIQKLTTDFGAQMEEYIRATFEVEQQISPGNPGNPGGEDPSNPGQPGQGGDEVVEEETKPIGPVQNAQVSAEDWDRLLSLAQVGNHITRMGYGPMGQTTTETTYHCDGYKIEKHVTSFAGDQNSSEYYLNKEGDKYYKYELTMGEFDKIVTKTEITEDEYNQERAMAKISFLSMFEFEDFYYHEMGFYTLTSDAYDKYAQYGFVNVEISFRDGNFEGINLIYRESGEGENDMQCYFSFSPETNEVQIPE